MFDAYLLATLYSVAWATAIAAVGNIADVLDWRPPFKKILVGWIAIFCVMGFCLFALVLPGADSRYVDVAATMASAGALLFMTPLLVAAFHLQRANEQAERTGPIVWRWTACVFFMLHMSWFGAYHLTHISEPAGPEGVIYILDPLIWVLLGIYIASCLPLVVVRRSTAGAVLHGAAASIWLTIFASRLFLLAANEVVNRGLGIRTFFK